MKKRMELKDLKDYTNKELLEEYNYLRNKLDGILEGGYGKYEFIRLEEIIIEMSRRVG